MIVFAVMCGHHVVKKISPSSFPPPPFFFVNTQSEWHLWDFGYNNNMAPESESIESELKCVTRSASAQVKNCWRRSFASYLTCATADNGTKEKRGDWWKSASQTLVGHCGTCFWVVAVQVECVNPLGTTIEISTTKKVNTIQSRLLFTSALLLVICIFTFSLFFFFFFFFLQNDWNKRRRMMAVGFRVEVICRWYYIYFARSFLILFFFFW